MTLVVGARIAGSIQLLSDTRISHPDVTRVEEIPGRLKTATGFTYPHEARAYYPSQTIPSGVATPLRFGAAADGGFAYTLLVPQQAGIAVLAVHFYQGHLGYVYAPLQSDRPEAVRDVDHDGLRAHLRERYGVEVQGLQFG